jgi:hypothetical protein
VTAAATSESVPAVAGRHRARSRTVRWLLGCALVAVLASACSAVTQTPFARTAGDAASILSAASLTLQFVHAEPPGLTVEYGEGSFINYHEQVASVPEELPTLQGAPDAATVEHLVDLLDAALTDLEDPCLAADCDWQGQVARFEEAKQELLAASQ